MIADLDDDEVAELGPLIRLASEARHERAGASKTYVAQFAEHPLHGHVHFHVIARRSDHPPQLTGPRIFGSMTGEDGALAEDRLNEIAASIGAYVRAHADRARLRP